MDPNANLEEQLALAHEILADETREDEKVSEREARLAELVLALDEWLVRGGFLPNSWRREDPSGALPKAAKR